MREPSDKSVRRMLLLAGAAVAVAAALFSRGVGLGIPAYRAEWMWRPLSPDLVANLLPAALVSALLILILWGPCAAGRWDAAKPARRAFWLIVIVLMAFALQCAMINAIGLPWAAPAVVIASPVATTYFSVSLEIDSMHAWLASYADQLQRLPYHAATHPPGLTLFFAGIRKASAPLAAAFADAPSPALEAIQLYLNQFGLSPSRPIAVAALVSALAVAFLGALSIIPVYLLASALAGPRSGLCAAFLLAGLPGLILLPASCDQVSLLIAATTMWLSYLAWRSPRLAPSLLAGISFALGLFVSFGLMALGAWLAAWAAFGLMRSRDRKHTARRLLPRVSLAVAAFIASYLVLYLSTGYRALAVAKIALFAHRHATTVEFPRTYWKWLLMNPVEMAVFAGLALVVAALWSSRRLSDSQLRPLRLFLAAWVVILIVLNLSGATRGEVGRIWLFLMWPLALATAAAISRLPNSRTTVTLLLFLQLCQALAMRGYLTMYDIF